MTMTSDLLRNLAEDDGNYIELDLTGPPRLTMKDGKGTYICTVPHEHFDNLRDQSFLEQVGGKWRLNDAGRAAGRQ